jgi:hypothetical protein
MEVFSLQRNEIDVTFWRLGERDRTVWGISYSGANGANDTRENPAP